VTAPAPLTPPQRRALIVLFLLVASVAALVAGGHTYAIDNEVQLQTTRSLAQGRADLESVDPYWVTREDGPYRPTAGGGHVAIVGIGHSILSLPMYGVSRAIGTLIDGPDRDTFIRTGTLFTNSLVLGALAVLVALVTLELGVGFRVAWASGAAYALATYALPHAKTYFTELSSALALILAVWALLRARRASMPWRWFVLCGFAVGSGVLIRASGGLFLPVFLVWAAVAGWRAGGLRSAGRALLSFAVGGAPVAVAFAFFNWWRFGSPSDIGYPRIPQEYPLLDGLEGLFWTPGKSLFLFAPLVIAGIVAIIVCFHRAPFALSLLATLAVVNIVFFSRVPYWAGDAAWGPRYQHPIVPLLVAPAAMLWQWRRLRPVLVVLAAFGLVGAFLGSVTYYNVLFVRADAAGVGGSAITYDFAWQPMLGSIEALPAALRDVAQDNRPGEIDRGPYLFDPFTHYGFFASEPRLDTWWSWVPPTSGSPITYIWFLPVVVAWIMIVRLCAPSPLPAHVLLRSRRPCVPIAGPGEGAYHVDVESAGAGTDLQRGHTEHE
jgi:hypothetical protein